MMESSTIEGAHTSMNSFKSSPSSSVLKKSRTANLSTHGTDLDGSHSSRGSGSQRVRIKRKHLKERSSPFEEGQRSPREDTENIPPALPATLPKDYEEIAQRLAGSFHGSLKDIAYHAGAASVEDIQASDTSQFDPGKHSHDSKLSRKSSVQSGKEPGQVPSKLKQGKASHRDVHSYTGDTISDVRVTQFAAGQKRKVMKESLSKRSEQMGPVRRVFEPRYIGSSFSDKKKPANYKKDEINQMAATTAAAVAATAPLIKYQYDLENKVSLILEKLQHLESATASSGKDRGQHPEVAAEKVQKRLDELTQAKLRELERLQFQQHLQEGHFKNYDTSSSHERTIDKGEELQDKAHPGIRKEKLNPDTNPLRSLPKGGVTVTSYNAQNKGLPMGYPEPLNGLSQPASMLPGQPLQATKHVRYAPAVNLHKGFKDDTNEHAANLDPQRHEIPRSEEGILSKKSSPLDTPAPRKRAPVPHSKSVTTRPNGGLLEEILSSQGEAIRQQSPDRSYIGGNTPPSQNRTDLQERDIYHSQVEKQAYSLLTEITSLRKDINNKIKGRQSPQATSSTSPKRFSSEPSSSAMFQNQLQRVTPEIRKDAERELQRWQEKRLAPPPLDEYMRKPYHPPTMTSPPSRPIHPSNLGDTHVLKGKTPVQPSSAIVQAETLLKRVQTSRKYLESNLEVIQRSKREQEFQEVIESMYADGDAAERAQIKLLVDDYIALVDSQVKEELLHYNSNLAFSPPTKLPPDKHQNPLAAETHKTSKPSKKKVSAKVDTGLRKSKEAGNGKPIKDITATGNETREKLKEKKSVTKRGSAVSSKFPVKDHQNNRNFSSIYGRNLLQQSQRTTLRDAPYLRIANKSPQTKRQRMSPKKDAASKQTTHTQTPSGTTEKRVSLLQRFPPETLHSSIKQNQSYIFQNYLDSPEILRETAIPLREPQVGGERTEPMVIFNQLDIPPSNQLKQNNVAVISMVTQKPQLEIKHLPPVDIDTEVSSMSEDQGAPVLPPPQLEEIKTQDLLDDQYQERKEQDADSDKDDIPESSEVLSFQGYGEYQGEYHGPAFPPQTPHQHQERRSEDTAADLGRKGLLEHRAMEWIEQELMAKMISEFHSRLPRPKQRTDSPESDKHDPVDAIGSGGLQLFVDVGQPVNPGLVSSLVKEVLEEDIAKMLGQHLRNLSDGDTSIPATDQRPHSHAAEVPNQELIHTPEVTPPHSPFHSPSPVLHEGQIKTPEATASDISQEAEAEPEETPEEEDNLIQGPTSPVGTPPMTPPPSKPGLTPEPGHVETPPPSFHENPPLLLEDTGTVGTPSLTIEESPPASPVKVKETPEQSPIPSLPLEPEATPSPTLPSSPRREVTPPPSTQSSSSSTTEDITATETSGREISAGEWLISQQSEGQVPKALMQSTFLDGTSLQEGAEASQTTSSDTLIETEELENDIAQDQEEGEIRGVVKLADIRDPMVAILTKLNQLPGGYYLPGQVAQAITRGDPSNSPGEVSEGQRPVMAPGVGEHLKRIGSGDDTNLPQSPGEVNLPKEGDIYNREPGETPRIIVKNKTEVPFKDSTLRLSQLNSRSSSSENGEKKTVKDDKRGTFSSDEGGEEEKEEVLGLQIAAPRIIQVGSHQSPREAESPKQREPPDRRQPNLDLFGTHNMSDQEVRPRTLTPDAINMEALLQSGYLSQTFSQSDGGPPLGSLVGQKGTLGGNESGGTLRQTGGALGTTFGTTMTEDSLEVAAAKKVPLEPQQKKFSITLPSTSNIEEEKLDWSHTESETGNQTVSDVSEISAGDL